MPGLCSMDLKPIKAINMADQDLLEKAKDHVVTEFTQRAVPELYFHNLDHTRFIVKAVREIAEHSKLVKKELIVVEIAAWFHDIGYLENSKEHKQNSAKMARAFLEQENTTEAIIKRITDLIMSTRLCQHPANPLEEILCDANFYYLSKSSFLLKNELLRRETEFLSGVEICAEKWIRDSIKLMETHQYFTAWCRSALTEKKEKNLVKLKNAHFLLKDEPVTDGAQHPKKLQKVLHKEPAGTERGIDTMFRIAAANNQRQFTLGDNKAHILITVNSIIMSIIVSVVLRKLAENPFLTWPTFIQLGTSFASTVFAILATRPKIDSGAFSQANLDLKDINLLYFGNFYRMTVSEYIDGMETVMADQDFIYRTIIIDAYWHGIVLGKKFSYLRKAYSVFLFGLINSIAAFVIAFLVHQQVPVLKKPGT
jgi:predicted metal-dependent HD superfamily phosphohydrolase